MTQFNHWEIGKRFNISSFRILAATSSSISSSRRRRGGRHTIRLWWIWFWIWLFTHFGENSFLQKKLKKAPNSKLIKEMTFSLFSIICVVCVSLTFAQSPTPAKPNIPKNYKTPIKIEFPINGIKRNLTGTYHDDQINSQSLMELNTHFFSYSLSDDLVIEKKKNLQKKNSLIVHLFNLFIHTK